MLLFISLIASGTYALGAPGGTGTPSASAGTAPEGRPVIWRFTGPLGEQLLPIIQQQLGVQQQPQLLSAEEIEAFFLRAQLPADLRCFDDRQSCTDPRATILAAMGAAGLVEVNAREEEGRYQLQLIARTFSPSGERRLQSTGSDLRATCGRLLSEYFALAELSLLGLPTGATITVDGRPLTLRAHRAALPAGTYQLRIEAPRYVPFTREIHLEERRLLEIEVHLIPSWSLLRLNLNPPGAKVMLDGQQIQVDGEFRVDSGRHTLSVSAPDYQSYEHEFDVEAGNEYDYQISLRLAQEPWKLALRGGHVVLDEAPQRVQLQFRYGIAAGGSWGGTASYDSETRSVLRVLGPLTLSGVDFGVQERHRWLQWEWVGFSYDRSGDETQVVLSPGRGQSYEPAVAMSDYKRFSLRILQGGINLPLWRVNPYLQLGFSWVQEEAELIGHGSLEHSGLRFRWQSGLRYAFGEGLLADLSWASEAWAGERSVNTLLVGVVYGLDLYRL